MTDSPAPPDALAGIEASNATLRETAKWLVTSFAAIGGVLVAGLSLSKLGDLTAATPLARTLAAISGIALAITGVTVAIWFTSRVLTPFPTTFALAERHPDVIDEVIGDGELLGGMSWRDLRSALADADRGVAAAGSDDDYAAALAARAAWEPARSTALALVGSRLLERRFRVARVAVVVGVACAAAGVGLFAWGANTPKSVTVRHAVALGQAPVRLRVALTPAGVGGLAAARACRRSTLTVLSIGGDPGHSEVVTVPTRGCRSVRFVLTPALGTPVASAPGRPPTPGRPRPAARGR